MIRPGEIQSDLLHFHRQPFWLLLSPSWREEKAAISLETLNPPTAPPPSWYLSLGGGFHELGIKRPVTESSNLFPVLKDWFCFSLMVLLFVAKRVVLMLFSSTVVFLLFRGPVLCRSRLAIFCGVAFLWWFTSCLVFSALVLFLSFTSSVTLLFWV